MFANASKAQCWRLKAQIFPNETINDIHFSDPGNGFMAVNAGIVGRSTDGGQNWRPLETPVYQNLRAITTTGGNHVWAVGDKGSVVHASDGGFHFSNVNLSDSVALKAVAFPGIDTGFVAGDSCIFRTVDGGANWTRTVFPQTSTPYYLFRINSLKFFGKDTGYAHSAGKLLKTTNGGASWNITPIPAFYMIAFATRHTGYAVADSGDYDNYYKTTNGGTTWFKQATALNYNQTLNDITVIDSMRVYILNNGTGTSQTRIYRSEDGGVSWQNNNFIPEIHWSTAICALSPTTVHIGTLWGSARKSLDRGSTWITPVNNQHGGAAICMSDATHVWQAGSNSVRRSADGGDTWIYNTTSGYSITKFCFPSNIIGYSLADNGLFGKTINGGQGWLFSSTPGAIADLDFSSTQFGIAAGNGFLSRTYDGGASWQQNALPGRQFRRIAKADSLHWYAVCDSNFNSTYRMYRSVNGGITWIPGPELQFYPIHDLEVVDTSHVVVVAGSEIYRSTDAGQTWQAWGSASAWYSSPSKKLSVVSGGNIGAVISRVDAVSYILLQNNFDRLYLLDSTGWHQSPIHASFTYGDVFRISNGGAWLTTTFGSIYRYYPEGSCPPDVQAPFLSAHEVKACNGQPVTVHISNYATYNLPYDTIRVQLLSGNNVVWTGTPSTAGTVNFIMPATAGSYQLRATVSNPQVPSGVSSAIPVLPQFSPQPVLIAWSTNCISVCCAGTPVTVGVGTTYALGSGYTYELHKINPGGSDSLISVMQPSNTIFATHDSFKLYYKVTLGSGVCYPSPYYYSDTIIFNMVQPAHPSVQLQSTAPGGTVCPGTPVVFTAHALNASGPGRFHRFYRVGTSSAQLLYSGPDSSFTLPPLIGSSADIFVKMFPGTGCNLPDSVSSDTLHLILLGQPRPTLSSSWGNDTLCEGKPITLQVDTAAVSGYTYWDLWKSTGGVFQAIATGHTDTVSDASPAPSTAYVISFHFPAAYCNQPIWSDTIRPSVSPALPAGISIGSNGELNATPAGADSYSWYFNGQFQVLTVAPLLINPASGSWFVEISSVDSCRWLPSLPVTVQQLRVTGHYGSNSWRLHPNPAYDQTHVTGPAGIEAQIRLYAVNGMTMREQQGSADGTTRLNLQGIPPGVYQVRIQTKESTTHLRLVLLAR